MRRQRAGALPDQWLQDRLPSLVRDTRAPRGFTTKVMNAVYREAVTGSAVPAPRPRQSTSVLGWYRRIGFSFMVTAVVLVVSLLVPPTSYPALIGRGAPGAALGPGPTAAVKGALEGATTTVQAALGERLIGGGEP